MQDIALEEQKRIELEILASFDAFCRLHDLQYQIAFGTLLGAIRHEGFIPWDDDIDIVMPRNDYERFFCLFRSCNTNDHLKLLSYRDKTSIYPFFKLVDTRTKVIEISVNPRYTTGVWIDIFPIDGMPCSDKNELFSLNEATLMKYNFVVANPQYGTTPLRRVVKTICYPIAKRIDIYKAAQTLDHAASQSAIKPSSDVGVIVWGSGPKDRRPYSSLQSIEVQFEGLSVLAPAEFDHILTKRYGDYMQLPPESQRVPHNCQCYWI